MQWAKTCSNIQHASIIMEKDFVQNVHRFIKSLYGAVSKCKANEYMKGNTLTITEWEILEKIDLILNTHIQHNTLAKKQFINSMPSDKFVWLWYRDITMCKQANTPFRPWYNHLFEHTLDWKNPDFLVSMWSN